MAPLLLTPIFHWAPPTASLASIAGESLALIDLRGPYSLRLILLGGMALLFASVAALGAASAGSVTGAVLAMGTIAALAGLWRHVNSDFGLSLGVSSCVLFLIALAYPPSGSPALYSGLATLLGGCFSVALQVLMWPIRAQQPLRRLVAESWLAVATLVEALSANLSLRTKPSPRSLVEAETNLRGMLDKTTATLVAAIGGKKPPFIDRLEALNTAAARLATRVGALGVALEPMKERGEFAQFATSLSAVLETLEHLASSVARLTVSRQPEDLVACSLHLRRATDLLDALETRVKAHVSALHERDTVLTILEAIRAIFPEIGATTLATVERARERTVFALELPEVTPPSLGSLTAALNLRGKIEPALVRYTARIAVLMMLGVGLYRGFDIPRGYWLPLTIIVVLQPDYGATRKKAGLRILGTVTGLALGSALLLLSPPRGVILATIGATMAAFAFWVRRNYALAIFFVTLNLGLLLHLGGTPTLVFALERLGATLAGGAIALSAAYAFWPAWERRRLPPLLSRALRDNRDYLGRVIEGLAGGGSYDAATIAMKRAAERANSKVFTSLERMMGDPLAQRERIEQAAALANGNRRLTRILTTIAIGLSPSPVGAGPMLLELGEAASAVLDLLALGAERGATDRRALEAALARLGALRWPPEPGPRLASARLQLLRANTELIAMGAAASRAAAEALRR
jgi:uncharacterized membrane protein YccC